jgi:peptidoglycan hydrolase-like protein with peptidoglycan-binding domain
LIGTTNTSTSTSVTASSTHSITPSNPTQTAGSQATGYTFIRDLGIGMSGPDVQALQQLLNLAGFTIVATGAGSPGQEGTQFGSLTKAALIRFQKANGIAPATGYFGPKTRAFVANMSGAGSTQNSASSSVTFTRDLDVGATGEDVRALQQYLNTHGFIVSTSGAGSLGQETANFGPATWAALIKFQQAKGITPAVGYFGPKTRATIESTLPSR